MTGAEAMATELAIRGLEIHPILGGVIAALLVLEGVGLGLVLAR